MNKSNHARYYNPLEKKSTVAGEGGGDYDSIQFNSVQFSSVQNQVVWRVAIL